MLKVMAAVSLAGVLLACNAVTAERGKIDRPSHVDGGLAPRLPMADQKRAPPTVTPRVTVDQAMAGFVAALYAEDANRLLSFFPRTGTWRLMFTGPAAGAEAQPRTMRYADIARGGKPTALFKEMFFDGDEPFVQYVQGSKGRRWEKRGENVFGPPDLASVPVHVRWRFQNGRYVIDEIAVLGS